MDKLPIYEAIVDDNLDSIDGICCVSLVEDAAVESDFMAFEAKEKLSFKVTNELEHKILGVLMRCDFPIYRVSDVYGEFYIVYRKETIEKTLAKMLKTNSFNTISLQHDGNVLENAAECTQLFIKDSSKNISPKGFEEISDGSLFAEYHIIDDNLWDEIMADDSKLNGFSIEIFNELKQVNNFTKEENKKMSIGDKIKETLKALFQDYTQVEIDGKTLIFDGELEVGATVVDENGIAIDGEYEYDGKIYVIVDGVVTEIKEVEELKEEMAEEPEQPKEEEVVVEEEPKQEEASEIDAIKAEIETIKTDFDTLKAEIDEIKAVLTELNSKSVAQSAEKEVENMSRKEKQNSKMDALKEAMKSLKN